MNTPRIRKYLNELELGIHNDNFPEFPSQPVVMPEPLALKKFRVLLSYLDCSHPAFPDPSNIQFYGDFIVSWKDQGCDYRIRIDEEPGSALNPIMRWHEGTCHVSFDFVVETEFERKLVAMREGFESTAATQMLAAEEYAKAYVLAGYFIAEMEI